MGNLRDGRASDGTRKEPHQMRLLRQAVKKAKQFEVRKLSRKSHQTADPSPVDITRKKKVVDLQKIEAQLTAMRALHPNEVLQLMCPQLGLPLPIPSPASPLPHPLSEWAIQRLRGIRCVQECVQAIKAGTRPPEVKVEEDQEAGEEDGEGETVEEEEAEVLGRVGCGNGAVEGVEETEQQLLEDVKHRKGSQSTGERLHEGLLVSCEKEQRGGGSDNGGGVRKEVPEEREGEEVAIPNKRKKAAAYLEKVANRKLKNRVGQRQRQKIAEVKYGWGAKHLVPTTVGAVRKDRSGGGKGTQKPYANAGAKVKEQPRKVYPPTTHAPITGALHPSWAAKAAQSKQLAMPGTGVKTMFSQDDE